jgi:uracil-DNA glycosylase
MFSNCEDHFQATLAILEPTLVILQGTTVAKRATKALPVRRAYSAHLYEAGIGEGRTLVCSFSHPSARGALRWGDSIDSPYLNRVVVPTLQKALRLT